MNSHVNSIEKKPARDPLQEMTLKVDRFMLVLLWAHLPIASFVAPYTYGTWREGLLASLFICLTASLSYIISKGTFAHRLLSSLLLLSYSIVLISVQYGRIEMHFHVFASLPLLILYKDWRIIPPAALLIALHHTAFNYCQTNSIELLGFPLIVFNYGNGWDIVILHAVFVVFQCGILIYYSEIFKNQYLEVYNTNKNLEHIVEERTISLKEETEKIGSYKKALDQVAIIALIDTERRIIDVNKNFEKISQYSKNELIGKNYSLLNSDQYPKEFFESSWQQINAGRVWRGEVSQKNKAGKHYWGDSAIAPIKNSNDEIINFINIIFDITPRKENEKVIAKQQEQMVSQSRLTLIGEIVSGVAHEINNPLAIISLTIGSARRMIKKKMTNTESFHKALEEIDQAVLRITNIISELRNISKDPSYEKFEECSIDEVVNDVLTLYKEKYDSQEINFKLDTTEEILAKKISIMKTHLSQALINLLINSHDEVSLQKEKWIKITVEDKGNNIIFKIIDSGKGIPENIQSKIFQPFFTTKKKGTNSGLGLSFSQSIIQKHNGQFYIDSNSSNTCFVISIPNKLNTNHFKQSA